MAKKLNVPILGIIENMSYAICPHCGEKLELFGASQGEKVADDSGLDFLGSLPWDTSLNIMVDEGKVEEYRAKEINTIIDKILEKLP